MDNRQFVSPWWQCSSTPVGFGQGFLTKERRDNTGASPMPLPDSSWFYLFPRLKSELKGRPFFDAAGTLRIRQKS